MTNSLKILIVEDSEIIRESLQNVFSVLTGADIVGFADNSFDAIDKYFEFHPDIVILDLMLKWSSGIEVMKFIKKHRPKSNIVILFSNITNPFIMNHCKAVGADYCLDKSNDFEKLINICKEIILDRIPESASYVNEVSEYIPTNIRFKSKMKALDFISSLSKFMF